MWKSRYLQEPVLKSSWSHKYHYNDLIQIGFNGFNWQVYSIISDKQKLPKSKLRTIYNKVTTLFLNENASLPRGAFDRIYIVDFSCHFPFDDERYKYYILKHCSYGKTDTGLNLTYFDQYSYATGVKPYLTWTRPKIKEAEIN